MPVSDERAAYLLRSGDLAVFAAAAVFIVVVLLFLILLGQMAAFLASRVTWRSRRRCRQLVELVGLAAGLSRRRHRRWDDVDEIVHRGGHGRKGEVEPLTFVERGFIAGRESTLS